MPSASKRNPRLGRPVDPVKQGKYVNADGYVRYSVSPHRGKYEQRVILAALCAEFCYYQINSRTGLPDGLTVEHLDHNRTHNCHCNLMLLDERIHGYISRKDRPGRRRRNIDRTAFDIVSAFDDYADTGNYHSDDAEVPF
jgi:hypothetical protein